MHSPVCIIYLFMGVVLAGAVIPPGDLTLVDHGYEGLVVGITDDVPQEYCNDVLHGLKSVMESFSNKLWQTTNGRASVRDVTVVLPQAWKTDSLSCSLWSPLTQVASPMNAHIRVSARHPVFGSMPWTQQSRGCGHQGDFIQMSSDLMRGASAGESATAARLLLSEWAKFRWGIFSEVGHNGDPLYPSHYGIPGKMEDISVNTCHIEGSNDPFCATDDHSPEMPNKHNNLCNGRPAWDIILESDDFNQGRNNPSNGSSLVPTIRFVQPSLPRVVIVVEDTAVMNLQRRWDFVRKAVRRVVVYDVPDGVYVGVVIFNSVASTVAPVSKMESLSDVRTRIGSSLPRNPSRVPESHKCLLCGIQEAIRAIQSSSLDAKGATVILITSGTVTVPDLEIEEMARLSNFKSMQIHLIQYPAVQNLGLSAINHGLQNLSIATHGSAVTVMDEGVGNDSKVTMMVALMDALLLSIRKSGPLIKSTTPMIVHSQAYSGGVKSEVHGKFKLDESMASSARFAVYYYDLNHVGNKILLTTPSGKSMSSVNIQEEDGDANVIFVNIPKAERGTWTYRLENHATSHQSLNIQVTTTENEGHSVNLQVWTNEKIPNNQSQPIIIYAEVKQGMLPIINARVVAMIRRLGNNGTGINYATTYIELFDNGLGDPDVTSGDGVYSRYLPNIPELQSGSFELSVTATNNNGLAVVPIDNTLTRTSQYFQEHDYSCCGSIVKYELLSSVQPFQRTEMYGILSRVSNGNEGDQEPPNQILDLRAFVNITTHTVTLRWSAPGDDYDWGRANMYEAVLGTSWKRTNSFVGNKIIGMPVPVLFGTEQSVDIQVEQYDQVIYVAIRAIDESGNQGRISNIARFWMPHPPTTTPMPTSPQPLGSRDSFREYSERSTSQSVKVTGFSLDDIAVIIGSITGFLVIIAIIVVFCYCQTARHRNCQQKKNGEMKNSVIVVSASDEKIKPDGNHVLKDTIVENTDELSKDTDRISPAHSWSATKLLQEHERRVSVTSGPLTETPDSAPQYQLQDPYPDVTMMGNQYHPSYQNPPAHQFNPSAYQYQYDYQQPYQYSHEELPAYTAQGQPYQSSQGSTMIISETPTHRSGISFPTDTTSCISSDPGFIEDLDPNFHPPPPPMYAVYNEEVIKSSEPIKTRVPPPVAAKPSIPTHNIISTEHKRRNVTQV
ncbi:unnamed protein product [Meganyctiphanes norvegica]|uniref:Calcium-activated chloride channel N-terminal domain-containing protein n=1 Tax=Meganyctiphanes norvegica TaxID=48144 RepID=A0AAV2RFG2_MEGNR